ncbi:MAG TPA: putative toxin-antitoxin system toxin component, PIN family [Pirellulaceae bacterium]|nr:putative toxin-antitoxin system toxin component, PIN family [Pirellulaceae bacterium]HMO93571.1 putative toxin-antitoxin system toxin component, PIN family [Pirellulaceae bacterium]HMP71584.1 putative toxin-antitoxin system toxin component, PIN family [Pirellulaceae bacterium]
MRVVLDTNILVRAASIRNRGPAFEVLKILLEPEHVLCSSPFMLDELIRVLRYPRLRSVHRLTEYEMDAFVLAIQKASLMVSLSSEVEFAIVPNDPKDDPIVQTAVLGKASVICTLDRHLYAPEVLRYCSERDISILSDVELLERLRPQSSS